MRFSEIAQSIPQLSDRLLSERMKELEARGLVERRVLPGHAGPRGVRAHGGRQGARAAAAASSRPGRTAG